MLNLVQIQERLKDVPMQALMAYANGSNPQVPPFVALGELNRRKQMQESAAAEQAQQMEGAPTIKEQIEQQAGLIALQGNRQRQAAQQQQQVQSAMPMAAPNTTTSEPAQLAGGGFIDDIVVPRDYQAGGKVDPEMLKRLMMRRAMQGGVRGMGRMPVPSGGISSLVPRKYRGGGPVAFNGTENSYVDPVGVAPYETEDMETRRKREELRRKYASLVSPLGFFKPVKSGQEAEYQKSRDEIKDLMNVLGRYNKEDLESIEDVLADKMGKFGGRPRPAPDSISKEIELTGGAEDRSLLNAADAALRSQPATTPPRMPRRPEAAPQAARPAAPTGIAALNPAEMFKGPRERSFDEIFAENQRRNKVAGIDEGFLDRYDERLGRLEAMDAERQAGQPMDQLISFLAGIAGSRRGAGFGEAGASGAKASSQLRAEQQALNRKLAGEMASLRLLADEKRQALRTGNKDKAEAIESQERALRAQAEKDKLDLLKTQEELKLRERQVGAQELSAKAAMTSAMRPPGTAGTSGLEAARLRARAAIMAAAQEMFALGGSLRKQYNDKVKKEGQEAADIWKQSIIQQYVKQQEAMIPELGGGGDSIPSDPLGLRGGR